MFATLPAWFWAIHSHLEWLIAALVLSCLWGVVELVLYQRARLRILEDQLSKSQEHKLLALNVDQILQLANKAEAVIEEATEPTGYLDEAVRELTNSCHAVVAAKKQELGDLVAV